MDSEHCAQGEPQTPMQRLEEELHLMKTAGIIEVAVRNPSVSDYMDHWEGRAEKAEAEAARLRAEAANSAAQRDEAEKRATQAEERLSAVEADLAEAVREIAWAVKNADAWCARTAAAEAELARRNAADNTAAKLSGDMREGKL